MPLQPPQVRWLTALGLAVLTLLTRLPFMARTLFEFDSIDFAVATFRFSLEQVTPHMPGYIGHVLLGRLLLLFSGDHNTAFTWLSVLLSIGSVLLIWRAGAQMRGERRALIAAILWIFTPLFWFYGEVATAYIHEAFFASAMLYLSLRLLNHPSDRFTLLLLAVALSLAGSMRQNSMLFFLPVVVYAVWRTKQPLSRILSAVTAFAIVTAAWAAMLFNESGGLTNYLSYAEKESIFRSQSVLFGNSVTVHAAVIAKFLFYLLAALVPMGLMWLYVAARDRSKLMTETWRALRDTRYHIALLVALPPALFYLLIYFMKAGYLLSILPSFVLITAAMIDRAAIWQAERIKRIPGNELRLTRPIITRWASVYTGLAATIGAVWFLLPLPGKSYELFVAGMNHASFGNDLSDRILEGSATSRLLNKAFAYTSVQGIRSIDRVNARMLSILRDEGSSDSSQIIDTWWSRWQYYYNPHATTIDVITYRDSLAIGSAREYTRRHVFLDTIALPPSPTRLLLIHPEHPDLPILNRHLALHPLDTTLGVYRIEKASASFPWKNKQFMLR